MRCHKAKKLIFLLLEEDLEQKEKEDLLEHLRNCRVCSLEWEEAKRSHLLWKSTLLGESLPHISEEEFAEGVEKRIKQLKKTIKEKSGKPKAFSFLVAHRKFLYPAVIIVLAFLSIWLGIFSKGEKRISKDVVVHSAFIGEQKATFSISKSDDKNIVFIWLEKS